PLQGGELRLDEGTRRIAAARVVVLAGLVGTRLGEGGGLVERRRQRAVGVLRVAAVDEARRELHRATSTSAAAAGDAVASRPALSRQRSSRSAIAASAVGQRPAPWACRRTTPPPRRITSSALAASRAPARKSPAGSRSGATCAAVDPSTTAARATR